MAIDRQDSPYRRGNRYDQLPIPMVQEHCIPVDAGAVQLVIESRRLTNAHRRAETFQGAVGRGGPRSTTAAPRCTCSAPTTASSTSGSTASRASRTTTTSTTPRAANTVVRIDELAVGDPIEFSLACVEHHLARHARQLRCARARRRRGRAGRRGRSGTGRGPGAHEEQRASRSGDGAQRNAGMISSAAHCRCSRYSVSERVSGGGSDVHVTPMSASSPIASIVAWLPWGTGARPRSSSSGR